MLFRSQQGLQPVSLHRNSSVETFDVYSSDSENDLEPFMSFKNINEPEVITYDLQLRRSASNRSTSTIRRRSVSSQSSLIDPKELVDDTSQQHLLNLSHQLFDNFIEAKVATDIAWTASKMVEHPSISDIRDVVKIKTLKGHFTQSQVMDAYVFTKFISHNKMPTTFLNPNILLISFPLHFYKKEFTSLENLHSLEKEFLTKLVDRIASLNPNLIICSDSVSRLVVEMLVKREITLINKVKLKVLKDIQRCTGADIISSIDRLALQPTLGTCGSFNVEIMKDYRTNANKSFIFLKHCKSNSGPCILLYTQSNQSFNLKKHLKFLILTAYSLTLEHSLLLDHQALQHPKSKKEVVVSSDDLMLNTQPAHTQLKVLKTIHLDEAHLLLHSLNQKIKFFNSAVLSISPYVHFGVPSLFNQYKRDLESIIDQLPSESTDLMMQYDRLKNNIDSVLEMDFKPSPLDHLNLYVLYNNELLHIDYFTTTDTSLGQYIEDCVFESQNSKAVFKKYCHQDKQVTVTSLPCTTSTTAIELYTECTICKLKSSPLLMNDLTWKYSFGKYLECHYYNHNWFGQCDHDIFQNHIKSFMFDGWTISFQQTTIKPFRVILPDMILKTPCHEPLKQQIVNQMALFCVDFYAALQHKLGSLFQTTFESEFVQLEYKAHLECATTLQKLQRLYDSTDSNDVLSISKFCHHLHSNYKAWEQLLITVSQLSQNTTSNTNRLLKLMQSNPSGPQYLYRHAFIMSDFEEWMVYPKIDLDDTLLSQCLLDAMPQSNIDNTIIWRIENELNDAPFIPYIELGIESDFTDTSDQIPLKSPLLELLIVPNHIYSHLNATTWMEDTEPTSMISYGLTHKSYIEQLQSIPDRIENDLEAFKEMIANDKELEIPQLLDVSQQHHAKITENDAKLKYELVIYYAQQFKKIRINCEIDTWFSQSLLRAMEMKNSGGKSKSWFMKTADDRFIIKSLPKHEFEAFLKFAPFYFEFMNMSTFYALPTILAKIFGCYRINYKNLITGQSVKMDVVVMENIFYKLQVDKIFDLKGSFRNRHKQENEQVLYDENLLESMHENPLFIREHAKKIIRASVWNDTLFLGSQNVMDYSILVGIVSGTNDLVIGIVDFIRTYTWDKRLESVLKEKGGNLIGENREPTIISPKQYKKRFRDCVEKYFLLLPDKFCNSPLQRRISQQVDQ